MKSENILRAARNSLLCFFMALGAGFLVACGSDNQVAPGTPPGAECRGAKRKRDFGHLERSAESDELQSLSVDE